MSRLALFRHVIITDLQELQKICQEIKDLPEDNRVFALDLGGNLSSTTNPKITSASIYFKRNDPDENCVYVVNLVRIHTNNNTYDDDNSTTDDRRASLQPFIEIIEDKSLRTVVHGAKNDDNALKRVYNAKIRNAFDTSYYANAMGFGRFLPLESLVFGSTQGRTIMQKARMKYEKMDWHGHLLGERPLTDVHIRYMVEDVLWLLDVHDMLCARFNYFFYTPPSPIRDMVIKAWTICDELMVFWREGSQSQVRPDTDHFLTHINNVGNPYFRGSGFWADLWYPQFELKDWQLNYEYPVRISGFPHPRDHEDRDATLQLGLSETMVSQGLIALRNERNAAVEAGSQDHNVQNNGAQLVDPLMEEQSPVGKKRKMRREEISRPSKISRRR